MSTAISPLAEWCASIIELLGVLTITATCLYSLGLGLWRRLHLADQEYATKEAWFNDTRQRLGRGILLGLELLVAADIIDSVAVELSLKSVGVLAAIVIIRTFLSFTLEVELTGRWPWQESAAAPSAKNREPKPPQPPAKPVLDDDQ